MPRTVQFHSGCHSIISHSKENAFHEFPSHRFVCPISHTTMEQEQELTPFLLSKGKFPQLRGRGQLDPPHSTPAWSRTPPAAHRRSCPRWWSPWLPPWSTPRLGWWLWCRAWLHRTKATSKHHFKVFYPPNSFEAVCRPGCKSLQQLLWASNIPSDAKLHLRAAPPIHTWEFLNSHCWQRPGTSPLQPFTREGCSPLHKPQHVDK